MIKYSDYIDAAFIQRALNQATMNVQKPAQERLQDLKAALQLAISDVATPTEPMRFVWDKVQAERAASVSRETLSGATVESGLPFRTKCPEHKEPRRKPAPENPQPTAFPHYFRSVATLEKVDFYRLMDLFDITSAPIQHAIKKLIAAGHRGAKDVDTDVAEAIKSLQRFQQMREEDKAAK